MPLVIGEKQISKISGPIGFSLLKPKKDVFNKLKSEGVRLPIIMMFGDHHFSDKYQCNMCACSTDSKECCLPVYSDEFLSLLDSMATKKDPIDFSIEGFFAGNLRENYIKTEKGRISDKKYAKEKNTPMVLLRENISICYIKEFRDTDVYEKECPTKRIRWHYMDTRQSEGTRYNLEFSIDSMLNGKYGINPIFDLIDPYNENKNERLSEEVLNKIISKVKSNYTVEYYYTILRYIMLSILDPEAAVDYFFKIATINNSLLIKQLNKLTGSLKDINFWKDIFKKYSRKNYNLNKIEDDIINNNKIFYNILLEDNIKKLNDFLENDNIQYMVRMGFYIGRRLNDNFLDLYYVLRTFKVPLGDVNPFLSISYFGNIHRENLVYLLTNLLEFYETVYTFGEFKPENKDENYRCINIPDIDFNKLALEYNVDIAKNINENSKIVKLKRLIKKCKEQNMDFNEEENICVQKPVNSHTRSRKGSSRKSFSSLLSKKSSRRTSRRKRSHKK
jgi:hypothetical protein